MKRTNTLSADWIARHIELAAECERIRGIKNLIEFLLMNIAK